MPYHSDLDLFNISEKIVEDGEEDVFCYRGAKNLGHLVQRMGEGMANLPLRVVHELDVRCTDL